MNSLCDVLVLFSTLLPPPAPSGFPLEFLVDGADLIVAGEVTDIKPGVPPYDNAVVKVSRVIKSLPGSGQPGTVFIAQPAAQSPLNFSNGLNRFSLRQEGIWFLTKDPGRQVYWAKHHAQFQHNQVLAQVAELVKTRTKLPEGKAVNGLVARAEIGQQMPAAALPNYAGITCEVRFSLKNVSEKPITICNFPGHQPLKVAWSGPKGAKKSDHYQWLDKAKIVLTKDSFVTIPPGGVRFIGSEAGAGFAGIWFTSPSAPAGHHRIAISFSFANPEEGKKFQIGNVWTGTVTANAVGFETKE